MKEFLPSWRQRFGSAATGDELSTAADRIQRTLCQLEQTPFCGVPSFQAEILLRLHGMYSQLCEFAAGRIAFTSTETWRTVYEHVLDHCQLKRYFSVALIRSEDYWRDAPGQRSLEFNYRLVERGFHLHRIFVIDEFFWTRHAATPSRDVYRPILEQHRRGIETSLVRAAALEDEPELCCDMGIYGDQAMGLQETDFQAKTMRFELRFARQDIQQAEQRWQQLLLYAQPLSELPTK